jgi:hypothetical protein
MIGRIFCNLNSGLSEKFSLSPIANIHCKITKKKEKKKEEEAQIDGKRESHTESELPCV